jgi:hypothetical protein
MDSTWTIVRWLNSNSAAVTAIAAAMTAVATVVIAWASWVSSRLVRLEKKIERANRMPILIFADEPTGDERSLYVKNVGYGPALNIVREIIEPGDLLRRTASQGPLALGSLAPSEKVYAFSSARDPVVSVLDDPEFHAVVECDDILGQSYEVVYRNRTYSTRAPIARKMPPSQAQRL